MPVSRYTTNPYVPQPIRKITAATTDVLWTLKLGERIDNLAYKFYNDVTAGWVIMCANPQWENEMEIPFGAVIRIPLPLQRVMDAWLLDSEI